VDFDPVRSAWGLGIGSGDSAAITGTVASTFVIALLLPGPMNGASSRPMAIGRPARSLGEAGHVFIPG
jgi:hypothetical protein